MTSAPPSPRRPPGRRVGFAVVAWLVVAALVRLVIAQPERCPDVDTAQVTDASVAAVDWLVRNQNPAGDWLYRYDRTSGRDLGDYNEVRHGGVIMSLYQAARLLPSPAADQALASADAGVAWVSTRTRPAAGGVAFGSDSRVRTGATALLVAGLLERRAATGSPAYDDDLLAYGRFLVATVEPSGAVLATWDDRAGAFVPGDYSPFFTGEIFWALAMLDAAFPDEGFGPVADRVSTYLATERDEAEDRFPPVADHWAGYGLAQLHVNRGLTDAEAGYLDRLTDLFGPQVRYESQRTNSTFSYLTRGRQTLGAGLGTIGEGLGSMWTVVVDDPRVEHLADDIEERTRCVAGMLVERQVDAAEAAQGPDPGRSEGAWFQFGITQMDDQQHALSALLLTLPMLEGEPGGAAAGPSSTAGADLDEGDRP
ncbi:MAG: hypothetical protein ACE367_02775 [Acidimicrobiales bacterium]